MKKTLAFILALCLCIGLCACSKNETQTVIPVNALVISNKNLEMEIGETFTLQCMIFPENATDYSLTWQSSNTEIATVDEAGVVSAIAPGSTTIVCSAKNGIVDACDITVLTPSAIEQLNEYEKKLFDYMVSDFLTNFYNASAVRVRKIESLVEEIDIENLVLLLNIQGTNKLGGTIIKDYSIFLTASGGTYLPCMTDSGLIDRTGSFTLIEVPEFSSSKINAALEEYWSQNISN